MATNTPNFSLPKPDANDNFNRAAYNTLIDAIAVSYTHLTLPTNREV